jgi:hypothetical protein
MSSKSKLTLTIDSELLKRVKERCEFKHLSISGIVENYFEFFINPHLYCFNCGEKFTTYAETVCPKCSWIICPTCGKCGCNLSDDVVKTAYYMRKVYEDLLLGRVKE